MSTVKIRNVGPKSAAWLKQVGVRSEEDVKRLGAVVCFLKVKRAGFKPGLNLLYALEGAVRDCHWAALTAEIKSELVLAVDSASDVEKGVKRFVIPAAVTVRSFEDNTDSPVMEMNVLDDFEADPNSIDRKESDVE